MARPFPEPAILEMHDYNNTDWKTLRPAWGEVGSWMYWGWDQLEPTRGEYRWNLIEDYLTRAASLGKTTSLSIIPYPGVKDDTTPDWVYGGNTKGGWPIPPTGLPLYYYPRYNDRGLWDERFGLLIDAFGKRFDGDPRINSVMIGTLLYGESVTTIPGVGEMAHDPATFVKNTCTRYAAAFQKTPLVILATGQTNRREICELCWKLGIMIGFNGLLIDGGNHVVDLPVPRTGLMQIAQDTLKQGFPMKWESAYNGFKKDETYWAMLTFLASGGTLLDLPDTYLDTLASVPGLWDWTLEHMRRPLDSWGLWVGRDTTNPTGAGAWGHGWIGPWERGIVTNAVCYAPGSVGYRNAPLVLTTNMQGYGGIGYVSKGFVVDLSLPPGTYSVSYTFATSDWTSWGEMTTFLSSPGTYTLFTGEGWIHRVVAEPRPIVPPPPPPTSMEDRVVSLEAETFTLADQIRVLEEKFAYLEVDNQALRDRLGEIDDLRAEIKNLL